MPKEFIGYRFNPIHVEFSEANTVNFTQHSAYEIVDLSNNGVWSTKFIEP